MRAIVIFTTLLLITTSTYLSAQPDVMPEIEKVLEEGRQSMTLPMFLDLLGLDGAAYEASHNIEGVEDFSYRKKSPYYKVSFRTNWFDFGFLTDTRHKILFSSIELLGVKNEEKRVFEQVHTDFQSFITAHETFYKIEIDVTDKIMSPFFDFTLDVDAFETNEQCKMMMTFVKKKDTESLEKWLKSMNPTIQAYAVIGFEIIQKQYTDLKPTKVQEKLITHIKQLDSSVPFSSSFDSNKLISLSEALSDSYLETYWYIVKDAAILKN